MSFDAIDKFKLPFGGALQQSQSRPARNPAVQFGDTSLPKLRGNTTEGIKIGPDRDVFQKSAASPKPAADKPAALPDKPGVQKFNVLNWLKALGNDASSNAQPMNRAKGGKQVAPAPRPAADIQASQAYKPNVNLFAAAKVNPVKRPNEQSGLASLLLSATSLGSLASMVAGPAALVAKPGLMNIITKTLPTQLP